MRSGLHHPSNSDASSQTQQGHRDPSMYFPCFCRTPAEEDTATHPTLQPDKLPSPNFTGFQRSIDMMPGREQHSNGGCKVVLSSSVAKGFMTELKKSLQRIGRRPMLCGFLANGDLAARTYAGFTRKSCEEKCVDSLRLRLWG